MVTEESIYGERMQKKNLLSSYLEVQIHFICQRKRLPSLETLERNVLKDKFFPPPALKAQFKLKFSASIWKGQNELVAHQIPQSPCWTASAHLWCAVGYFPECPGQSEDSCTEGSPHHTRTSSHCCGRQTVPLICSQCSWGPPEWNGSVGNQEGSPATLRWVQDGRNGEKHILAHFHVTELQLHWNVLQ